MRKISTQPITYPKELFLAICLISGEVSPQTVRAMKKDFGEHTIARVVIFDLVHQGVIKKIHYRSGSGCGYVLTEKGYDYLETKVPDKYNYDFFCRQAIAGEYREKMHERNQAMSMILYQLERRGISITDHYALAADLFNGRVAEINEPFFITIKELRAISQRLASKFPTMSYGCIIAKDNVIAVYYPDKEHHLWVNNETEWHGMLTDITRFPNAHFKDPRVIEALYLYSNMANLKDSFVTGVERAGTHSASTRKCYQELKYYKSHILVLDTPTFELDDILDREKRRKIDEYFIRSYDINLCPPTIDAPFADGLYNDDMYTALVWDLNPQKLVQIMKYIIETGDKPLALCFKEQRPIVDYIFSVNKRLTNKVFSPTITRNEVMENLGYKPEENASEITREHSGS